MIFLLTGCAPQEPLETNFAELELVGSMPLLYAQQFSVDYLAGGYALINIAESGRFLLLPEGQEPPANLDNDITLLRQPLENIYLAATSAMCLFDALDALPQIRLSGTKAEGWYIENARAAMEQGEMLYAGKYSAPDYELLLAEKCDLAIESTMINHTPQVREKLQALGIPVLIERSSYEAHPLGRTEWIKLYGLLSGKLEQAEALLKEQAAYVEGLQAAPSGRKVAFFYISSNGNAVARKSGDYVVKMIELAGGSYIFENLGDSDSAAGAVNLEMESFYATAREADIIIYNSSIDGEVSTLAELLAKNQLLEDFRAVEQGEVWCTNKNLFQESTGFGLLIADLNRIFSGEAQNLDKLNYLYRLR